MMASRFLPHITTTLPEPSLKCCPPHRTLLSTPPLLASSLAFSLPQPRRVLATPEENIGTGNQSTSDIASQQDVLSDPKAEAKEAVKKGQATAIVTGAIAVILGVAYLILVQVLDSRGVNLVPPPPEAFEL